jgi:hypothetical protein
MRARTGPAGAAGGTTGRCAQGDRHRRQQLRRRAPGRGAAGLGRQRSGLPGAQRRRPHG